MVLCGQLRLVEGLQVRRQVVDPLGVQELRRDREVVVKIEDGLLTNVQVYIHV